MLVTFTLYHYISFCIHVYAIYHFVYKLIYVVYMLHKYLLFKTEIEFVYFCLKLNVNNQCLLMGNVLLINY